MNNKKKIIFAGSNNYVSYNHLKILIKFKFNIIAILTKPYCKNSRYNQDKLNSLIKLSKKYKLLLITTFNQQKIIKILQPLKPDIMIVVSYGLIIKKNLLKLPLLGCFNIHFSLLPRWRGAAPIQRAILANDLYTGITIIKMNEYVDDGPIIYFKKYLIHSYDNTKSLINNLLKLSLKGLIIILIKLTYNRKIIFYYQNKNCIKYANKITKKEALLNWQYPALYLQRCIRAFNLWPGCFFYYKNKRIKIFKAEIIQIHNNKYLPGTIVNITYQGIKISTSKDIINIIELQIPGKKIVEVKTFINSYKDFFIIGDIIKFPNNINKK